jgi:hypothetical protein
MARIDTSSLRSISLFVTLISLSSCTITETVSDILSSTTPGDWYTRDGLPKAEHRVDVFLATNLNNVKTDIARGRGEYLDSLGRLLDVAPSGQSRFAEILQEQYPSLSLQDTAGVTRTVIAAAQALLLGP